MAAPQAYSPLQKLAHWLVAGLILVTFTLPFLESSIPRGAGRDRLWWLHVSLGLLVIALVALRLGIRIVRGPAPPAPGLPTAEWRIAALGHIGLYWMLVCVLAAGIVLASLRGNPLSFFDLFTIPAPLAPNRPLSRQVQEIHEWLAYLLVAAATGHALIAVWRHYVRRDGVLLRMLPHGAQSDAQNG